MTREELAVFIRNQIRTKRPEVTDAEATEVVIAILRVVKTEAQAEIFVSEFLKNEDSAQ